MGWFSGAAVGACERPVRMRVMADRDALIEHIKQLAVVHGRVTLSSGREADYYIDMRRVTLDGAASPLVGQRHA